MAKRKRSKRTKKTNRTGEALRIGSSFLTTVIDEIDELVELLRFLPELNILSDSIRAREIPQVPHSRWEHRHERSEKAILPASD